MVKTPYVTPLHITEAAEAFLDEAIRHHTDSKSDETLIECLACGMWEEHEATCPVAAVWSWLTEVQT